MFRVRRVIVGVSGSPGSLQAFRHAAGLALVHEAALVPVLAWQPPGGELAERHQPSPQLHQIWREAAWQRLWTAVDLAVGGVPAGLAFDPLVLRGEPGRVLVDTASEPGDVLVLGAGRRGMGRAFACRVSRYCVAHAQCPVVSVPPSPLARLSHGLRGWAAGLALRRRGVRIGPAGPAGLPGLPAPGG